MPLNKTTTSDNIQILCRWISEAPAKERNLVIKFLDDSEISPEGRVKWVNMALDFYKSDDSERPSSF